MKKVYILIGVFIFFVIGISIVGSFIIMGDVKTPEIKDVFTVQINKEVYFSCYGYTIDKPNVIVNPYGNSPLTAIVMFETDDYSEVELTIKSKDGSSDINYTFSKNKYHYIPVYGLYADYDNTIVLESEDKVKVINIKTSKLPEDFKFDDSNNNANFTFYNVNYPYAVDSNNEVRWYLNEKYYGNITVDSDSSIIIGSNRYNEDGNAISLYRMNMLGKVYNEYLLSGDYYGFNAIYNDNIVVLSDRVLLVDIQTGEIMEKLASNDDFDYLGVVDDKIVVSKEDKYYIVSGKKIEDFSFEKRLNVHDFYDNTSEYRVLPSNRFGDLLETGTSSKNVPLLKYDKKVPEEIEIKTDTNRLSIINNSDDVVYLILDKFFDKRIYEVNDIKYVNFTGLSGKYTIYIKTKNKLYKTDYYIEV